MEFMASTIHLHIQHRPADVPLPSRSVVYRRRRVAVGLALVILGALLWTLATWVTNSTVGMSPVEANRNESGFRIHVVQPGETLWSIATELSTGGDVRDTVDRFAELNGGSAISVGQRLILGS